MNNLQQVINQAQSDISKGFVFVHIKTPDLKTLLDGFYDEQWRAIWYEGHIEDASRSAAYWQKHYNELKGEHKAMKEALHEIVHDGELELITMPDVVFHIHSVLSTLSCTD
jgi:hypothetical protein